jgi:hypothetical protein
VEIRPDLREVVDFEGFLCALAEAIHGPGGYFGRDLLSLQDCLRGGFGLKPPWTLRVAPESCVGLNAAALVALADQTLVSLEGRGDSRQPGDEEQGAWWRDVRQAAVAGRDLWTELHDVFVHHGVTVIDEDTADRP